MCLHNLGFRRGNRHFNFAYYHGVKKQTPFLVLKKKQAQIALDILLKVNSVRTRAEFLLLCKRADRFGFMNDSKNRTKTSAYVAKYYLDNKLDLNEIIGK